MSEPSVQQILLSLSPLDAAVLAVGVLGATALHFMRKMNGRATERGQWLGDALNVATFLVLGLICVRAVFGDVFGLDLSTLTASNGIIIAAALVNCMITIGLNLLNSIKPQSRYAR